MVFGNMAMTNVYVIDTNGIISVFSRVFEQENLLSPRTTRIVERALLTYDTDVKLSIPSIVFVEIFEKWFNSEEFASKFHYEVFEVITRSPNIEIKPIEKEVLENLMCIEDELESHDIHDKLILASAMMLQCSLITTDTKITAYVNSTHIIPAAIN